ncbi:AI-2E family transporter [Paenibacillus marinisediminis]
MLAFYQKYWRTAFDIGLIVLTVYLTMFAFSSLYAIAAPIFLALLIFWIIEPFASFLNRRGLKKFVASAISIMLFVLLILAALIGAGVIFTNQINDLIMSIPDYRDLLVSETGKIASFLQSKYEALPNDVTERIQSFINDATLWVMKWFKLFLSTLISQITVFSGFIFKFGIGIVLAYFLSTEIETWRKVATEKTPRTFKNAFHFLKENVFRGLGIYLKAQMKLITVTFTLVFISLLLLDVSNAFSIALLSALFDILPVLGVPVIFIPWALYCFIVGSTWKGIMLLVILAVVMGTRQILEPKITGNSLGVSAFTMLSFMIISMSLFGVAGLILSPILLILVKALYDQGHLKRWIRMPQEEFDSNPLAPESTELNQTSDNK